MILGPNRKVEQQRNRRNRPIVWIARKNSSAGSLLIILVQAFVYRLNYQSDLVKHRQRQINVEAPARRKAGNVFERVLETNVLKVGLVLVSFQNLSDPLPENRTQQDIGV